MVVPVTGPGGAMSYQNYTWNVYVGATGQPLSCTNCRGVGVTGPASPHPGNIYAYEIVPGGATSLDPAVDYETTGGEIIQNVFETLIQYNATSTASYDPVLSLCIPGPAAAGPTSCQAQFGSDLNYGPNGTYWTFPIDPNASFYDPGTHTHWAVYPSDVMFSVARTLMWLENPSQYTTNGWIIGQSLLPIGNPAWDQGLHVPWNNTPQNVLSSMLINDSKYCPATVMSHSNGCITFKADGTGSVWSYFLEFVQDSEGASVVPCGWYTHMGAGIPGFYTNAPNGDGPCYLPGTSAGTSTTNSSSFQNYVSGASPTLYDNIITLDTVNYQNPYPQVRWDIVGSGAYYLQSVNQGQGYILKANPYYAQPNCVGQPGCYPANGHYPGTVYVFWDPNSVTGVEQYIAGQSDFSVILPTDIPTILNLVKQDKVVLFSIPTLNLFPEGFSFVFDPSAAQSASGLTTNIPGDFFANPGMRMFFAQTFPYWTYINIDNLVDGVPFIQGEGGAIPQYLGNYYPENVTWPGMNISAGQWPQIWQDPSTTASASVTDSAAWWWANITNPSSPIYDKEAVACETTTCTFPIGSEAGAFPFDAAVDTWISIIEKVTGGAIAPTRWDPTFTQIVTGLGDAPGTSPFDTFVAGWLPDYPDPTDYMAPFWFPDGSYTYAGAMGETLLPGGEYNSASYDCSQDSSLTWTSFSYWANYPAAVIPTACQGTAYAVMTSFAEAASSLPVGPVRVLYYNMVSHIADKLVLDIYVEQQVGVGTFASWINPDSFWYNVMAPGQLWFNWNGNNVL